MPFSATPAGTEAEWSEFFETVLKPSIENAGLDYQCLRSTADRGNIVKAIVQSLNDAHVVVADLTDSNPNVFYELGVRHALTNRTILLAQNRGFIPFDLRPYANHIYDWKTEDGREILRQKLASLLREVDESPDRADNPVSDFLGGRPRTLPDVAQPTSTTASTEPDLFGSLAGPGSGDLDVTRVARLLHGGDHRVEWRTMIRRARSYFAEVWPRRIDELGGAEPPDGSGIAENAIYDACLPTIEKFSGEILVLEQLALALADGEDIQGVTSLFRIFEDWITLSDHPRSGRNLRAATGAPELLALRVLLNCGAKAGDNGSYDVMGALLGTPFETRTGSGQIRLAPLPERRSMFFPEGLLGRADLGVLYVARESWKSAFVKRAFASEQDFLAGLSRFLFVTSLVADARFPDSWGRFYPGFKLISGASAAITSLVKRLSATPDLVAALAALTERM